MFKAGDKVVCVDEDYYGKITPGDVYEVLYGDENFVIVDNDECETSQYRNELFKLLIENQQKPYTKMLLSTDSLDRKQMPITTGVLDYFPLAIAEVAKCSKAGNDQHNPGKHLHWDKSKSTDHADCIARHLIDRDKYDTDGIRHSVKLAWRALAYLQIQLENEAKDKQ